MRIARVDETEHLVELVKPTVRRLTDSFNTGQFARFYVDNALEALTEPGEWYLDRPGGTLYYIPMPGERIEKTVAVAPKLQQLVRIVGKDKPAEHIRLRNLAFAHAEWCDPEKDPGDQQAAADVPGAVFLQNARNCMVQNCTVSQMLDYAIEVGPGCRDLEVDNCVLTDLGAGGIKIGHDSNHTVVRNCEISQAGKFYHQAVGVWIGHSSDNTVTRNDIHHLYYTGISVGWTWGYHEPSQAARNRITHNHIHHIGQGWLSDMAGIYTLGVSPGTELLYNRIHDVEADQYGGWGLYNDEGSTGILLENNIVYRTTHGGYHQHYGKENIVRNNVFAFGKHAQLMRSREEEHLSFTFERNIVYFAEPTLLGGNWKNDKFRMDNNLYWRAGGQPFDFAGASFEQWKERGHDVHSIIADPLFADPQGGDFTLKPGSPAEKIGFRPIDTSHIGRAGPGEVAFKMHVIDADSRFEGAGVLDVNRDGVLDIQCGPSWYEGPKWTKHFVRKVEEIGGYHMGFCDLPVDVDGDGWTDTVNGAWHNKTLSWVRNPGGSGGQFQEIPIDTPGNVETAILTDINADGQPDVLPDVFGEPGWYEFHRDPAAKHGVRWEKHALPAELSGPGIGAGDINGDGRCDVVGCKGWAEQPADPVAAWTWHPEFDLVDPGIPILVHDVDGDGDVDLIYGIGHNYGVYWLEQERNAAGQRAWRRHEIDRGWSQAHVVLLGDLDGDGRKDLVTGKRWYAHDTDPGANEPRCVYWYDFDPVTRAWHRHTIQENGPAGVGTSAEIIDIDRDGDLDLILPGKSGLYLFENLRRN